jgi:hypothetical protein
MRERIFLFRPTRIVQRRKKRVHDAVERGRAQHDDTGKDVEGADGDRGFRKPC